MALPSPCSGVIVSPSTHALPTIAIKGSRFMMSAVRNGPTRMVETKMKTMAAVVARLMPTSAAQPALFSGGCQVWVIAESATKIAACAMTEYQVVNRASAPTRKARVIISTPCSCGERKRNAGQHQTRRMRADHDRKPAESRERASDALPTQAFKAGSGSRNPRKQGIDEIGEYRGRHIVQVDRLKQTVEQDGE